MFIDLITKTYISRLAHKSRSSVNHETESFWRLFLQAATADVDVDVTFCCRLGAAYRIFIFICISISISTSICISSRNIVAASAYHGFLLCSSLELVLAFCSTNSISSYHLDHDLD